MMMMMMMMMTVYFANTTNIRKISLGVLEEKLQGMFLTHSSFCILTHFLSIFEFLLQACCEHPSPLIAKQYSEIGTGGNNKPVGERLQNTVFLYLPRAHSLVSLAPNVRVAEQVKNRIERRASPRP